MRREKRPFVVEVKRGDKRAAGKSDAKKAEPAKSKSSKSQALAPIEANVRAAMDGADQPANRRILEALDAPRSEAAVTTEAGAPRRGRKPGSKNKPRVAEAVEPKRRGRPPKSAGAVRTVAITADLANAALDKISRSAAPPPTGVTTMFASDAPPAGEQPVKRGRGRPRKIVPPGGFPPKVPQWVTWVQTPDEPESEMDDPTEAADDAAAASVNEPQVAPLVRALERMSRPAGLRAGSRWSRRLRGYAQAQKRAHNR
jgi:hypothetical protein